MLAVRRSTWLRISLRWRCRRAIVFSVTSVSYGYGGPGVGLTKSRGVRALLNGPAARALTAVSLEYQVDKADKQSKHQTCDHWPAPWLRVQPSDKIFQPVQSRITKVAHRPVSMPRAICALPPKRPTKMRLAAQQLVPQANSCTPEFPSQPNQFMLAHSSVHIQLEPGA